MTVPAKLKDPDLLSELTPREQAFVRHPLVTTDPVAAARDVGYSESMVTTRAYSKRKELLYFIQHYNAQRMARHEITADRVIGEVAAIAFADETMFREVFDTDHGTTESRWKDPMRLPPPLRAVIASLEYLHIKPEPLRNADGQPMFDEKGEPIMVGEHAEHLIGLHLHSKLKALEMLGKFLGMDNVTPQASVDPNAEQRKMLEQMTPEELDEVRRIFGQATDRIQKTASAKRDAKAITGESKRVK